MEKDKPRHGIQIRMTAVPLDAHTSNVVKHSRQRQSCNKLQGLEVTKMYTLTPHKASAAIFGGVLMTNKLTHCQVSYNKASLCGYLSLISAKRVLVRPIDLN